ncbi:geranylgeranyl transferase type-1 subunit beta [Tribolium castaneum]|uniref:Geranylgeranyl transferase type-1 subunit beta n=1 Tax=Tribolium castaneum TaxID=7070 RepID=D6WCZ2_TRICA|nr:PREDICTED: geranylgeranyl transferase type-1 subunit beta [Tribolium castaneum]EEZ99080.2 Geranylgeranyl transferase type-1 subunit beta-like Protein [Tribolium castaneum]|eukprot:XP_969682.2 PREDICTED: geranylgeranyl transferase type-1 subunit beta [Tribolium castaneum]
MDFYKIKFNPTAHKKYLLRILRGLPPSLSSMDTHRVILTYFAVSGLDLLNELDSFPNKQATIEWLYSLQVFDDSELVSGFQGSSTLNTELNQGQNALYKWGHIATTYSALATLVILKDDLERVHRKSIIKSLRSLQLPNGCFMGAKDGTEHDMRFVFCAACICYILDDFSGMDIDRTVDFILKSISYDFGIAQGPQLESHSGSTFCAVATLALTKQLHRLSPPQLEGLKRWLLNRFENGFTGRPNKPSDTCYSFWTGGALKILNAYQFIEEKDNDQFILVTQDRNGGFSKWVNTAPDAMHTYLGLAGLSFMNETGISSVFPDLNMSTRAHEHLLSLHRKWRGC